MTRIALTRDVSPAIGSCELTHLDREPIDLDEARRQHAAYERALDRLGCAIVRLPPEPDLPDSVFVEDTAVVLDEIAIITRPGASSRRPETESVARALEPFRPLARIDEPGTLDGGDVLLAGRTIFVGRTPRTNGSGIESLERIARPFGYRVVPVDVRGCLHLKSGVTLADASTIVVNPEWIDPAAFDGLDAIAVDPKEPFAGNVLRIDATVVIPEAFPRTRGRIELRGIQTVTVPASELAKAEGGVTCCSVIFAGT